MIATDLSDLCFGQKQDEINWKKKKKMFAGYLWSLIREIFWLTSFVITNKDQRMLRFLYCGRLEWWIIKTIGSWNAIEVNYSWDSAEVLLMDF